MPPKRKSHRPAPKVFHCSGHGDCRMVFTRSEHLARHIRKHTGEKPFKCIVPGCTRMFTRFDNMMQHTRTHERNRKKSNSSTSTGTGASRVGASRAGASRAAPCATTEADSADAAAAGAAASAAASAVGAGTETDAVVIPASAPIISSTPSNISTLPTIFEVADPSYDNHYDSMIQNRTLPPPSFHLPPSQLSSHPLPCRPLPYRPVPCHPLSYHQISYRPSTAQRRRHSAFHMVTPSPEASFSPPSQQQQQSPVHEHYYSYQEDAIRTPMLSPSSTITPPSQPVDVNTRKRRSMSSDSHSDQHSSTTSDGPKKRRLSNNDLQTPIRLWSAHTPDEDSDDSPGVDVTCDEYDAIEGMAIFTKIVEIPELNI